MTAFNGKLHDPVMTVTAVRRRGAENRMREGVGFMNTNRLASQAAVLGFAATDQRNRVDPRKLLDLINRIKSASGAEAPALPHPKPAVKAG